MPVSPGPGHTWARHPVCPAALTPWPRAQPELRGEPLPSVVRLGPALHPPGAPCRPSLYGGHRPSPGPKSSARVWTPLPLQPLPCPLPCAGGPTASGRWPSGGPPGGHHSITGTWDGFCLFTWALTTLRESRKPPVWAGGWDEPLTSYRPTDRPGGLPGAERLSCGYKRAAENTRSSFSQGQDPRIPKAGVSRPGSL